MDFPPTAEAAGFCPPPVEWSFSEPSSHARRRSSSAAKAPTQVPIQAPAQAPTQAPIQAATQAPIQAPTQAPTQAPNPPTAAAPPSGPVRRPLQLDVLQAQAANIHRQLQQTGIRRSTGSAAGKQPASESRPMRYSLQSIPSVELPIDATQGARCTSWQADGGVAADEYLDLDLGEALHLSNIIQAGISPEAATPPTRSLSTSPTCMSPLPPVAAGVAPVTAVCASQSVMLCDGSGAAATAPLPQRSTQSTTSQGCKGRQIAGQVEWREKMSAGLSELSQILKTKGLRGSITVSSAATSAIADAIPGPAASSNIAQPALSTGSYASDHTTAHFPSAMRHSTSQLSSGSQRIPSPTSTSQEADSAAVHPVVKESNALQAAKLLRRSWSQHGQEQAGVSQPAALLSPPRQLELGAARAIPVRPVAEAPRQPELCQQQQVQQLPAQQQQAQPQQAQPQQGQKQLLATGRSSGSFAGKVISGGGAKARASARPTGGEGREEKQENAVAELAGSGPEAAPARADSLADAREQARQRRRAAARAETARLVEETVKMVEGRGGSYASPADYGQQQDAATIMVGPHSFRGRGVSEPEPATTITAAASPAVSGAQLALPAARAQASSQGAQLASVRMPSATGQLRVTQPGDETSTSCSSTPPQGGPRGTSRPTPLVAPTTSNASKPAAHSIPLLALSSNPLMLSSHRTSSDSSTDAPSHDKPPALRLRASLSEVIGAEAAREHRISSSDSGAIGTPVLSRIPFSPRIRGQGEQTTVSPVVRPLDRGSSTQALTRDSVTRALSRDGTASPTQARKGPTAVRSSWSDSMSRRPMSASAASLPRASASHVLQERAIERGEIPRVRSRKVWGEAAPPSSLSRLPSPPATPAHNAQFSLTPREKLPSGRTSAPPSRSDTPSRLEALFSTPVPEATAPVHPPSLRRTISDVSDSEKPRRSAASTPTSTPSTPAFSRKPSTSTTSTSKNTAKANQKATAMKLQRSLSTGSKTLASATPTQPTKAIGSLRSSSLTAAISNPLHSREQERDLRPNPLRSTECERDLHANPLHSGRNVAATSAPAVNSKPCSQNGSAGLAAAANPNTLRSSQNGAPKTTPSSVKKNSSMNQRGASSTVVDKQAQAVITLGPGGRGAAMVDMSVREIAVPSSGPQSSVAKLRAAGGNKAAVTKKDAASGSDKPAPATRTSVENTPLKYPLARNVAQRVSTAPAASKADKDADSQKRRPAPRGKAITATTENTLAPRDKRSASPAPPTKRSASPAPQATKRSASPAPSNNSRRAASPASSRTSDSSSVYKEREAGVMDCMWLMLYDGMTVISRSAPLLSAKVRTRAKPPPPANIFAKWLGTSLLPMIPEKERAAELLATEVPEVYRSKTGKKLASVDMILNHLQDCWFGLKPIPNTTTARLSLSLRASFQPPTATCPAGVRVVKNGKDCPADLTTAWLADYTVPGLMFMYGGQLLPPSAAEVLANGRLISAWTLG